MKSPFDGKRVHFLTGSQHMYGPETLASVATQSRQVATVLGAAPMLPVGIEWRPVLTDSASIAAALAQANADPDCVGVITWMHTFSPAKMWIKGLQLLDKPLLHLHTQAAQALPWASLDMDFMNLNQSAHGDREFGHIQTRLGSPRTVVVGMTDDPGVQRRVSAWARAATARAALRDLRVARFGDNMRGVAVTEGDKVAAEMTFGASVDTFGVNDLVSVVEGVEDSAVDLLIAEYLDRYQVVPQLRPTGDRHDALRVGARIEAGLRQFLSAGDFRAFTTNFEDLGGLRQLPGLAVQRLMADGYGFGGEGDWKTAMLLHTVKVMGWGLPGGTSFMEDYTYHFGPGRERVLGAHMLEVCPSLTSEQPSLEIHPLSIGGREDPVRLKFVAAPGPGIIVGLADLGPRFRLTANQVQLVEPDAALPHLPVACAIWEPHPSLATSAECWITAGAPHHTVLSTAVDAEMIELLASMLDTELAVIDSQTTSRTFARELLFAEVHYRLGARR